MNFVRRCRRGWEGRTRRHDEEIKCARNAYWPCIRPPPVTFVATWRAPVRARFAPGAARPPRHFNDIAAPRRRSAVKLKLFEQELPQSHTANGGVSDLSLGMVWEAAGFEIVRNLTQPGANSNNMWARNFQRAGRLTGGLASWLAGWLAGWLTGSLAGGPAVLRCTWA